MLTTEELMVPRYLITAEDTSGNLKKGQILVLDEEAGAFWCGKTCYTDDQLNQWPHLFQPLEWWQERPESELPQYLALNKRVFRVTRIEVSNNSIWLDGCEHTLKYILRVALPATEAEYLTYKKQTDAR